jgi:N-acyl-D-amino-acid deacylase
MKTLLACLLAVSVGLGQTNTAAPFDAVIRHGTILDGSGGPRYDADLGIRGGHIVAIGDLAQAKTAVDLDARGLFVTPGFINIHAHPSADALPTAVNMLTQGVTTEITNPDGGGPVDLAEQMSRFEKAGLAINIGGFIGFNSIWQNVVGDSDRRPNPAEIDLMRASVIAGLEHGAWGVSAGLDYKPGYFAQTEEVIKVVDVAKPWRTNFTNHDRITPESNFSSRVGITETVVIGQKSGLVPIVTHMKVQGIEQGTAGAVLASMQKATSDGHYTAADAYPYLAGQSGLGALIVPGWAQEGGRDAMLKRFADPATRTRIVAESEQAMTARFGGPQGVYLPRTQQELTAVMQEMDAGAGETVLRIIEKGDPGAILRFGIEADLIKILQDPATSMACDCGASTATRVHPRFYGSFPRVLGRYVREQKIMSWEEAIRKMSGLPASTIGMVDRGFIAVGMAADITVFDPNTVIDRATYESPALPAEGIRHVLVNGKIALRDGTVTGAQGGHAQLRTTHMPSRPMTINAGRRVRAPGIELSQEAGARAAKGNLRIEDPNARVTIRAEHFGVLQVAPGWASVTGIATVGSGESEPFTLIVERDRPMVIYSSPRRTVSSPLARAEIRSGGAR